MSNFTSDIDENINVLRQQMFTLINEIIEKGGNVPDWSKRLMDVVDSKIVKTVAEYTVFKNLKDIPKDVEGVIIIATNSQLLVEKTNNISGRIEMHKGLYGGVTVTHIIVTNTSDINIAVQVNEALGMDNDASAFSGGIILGVNNLEESTYYAESIARTIMQRGMYKSYTVLKLLDGKAAAETSMLNADKSIGAAIDYIESLIRSNYKNDFIINGDKPGNLRAALELPSNRGGISNPNLKKLLKDLTGKTKASTKAEIADEIVAWAIKRDEQPTLRGQNTGPRSALSFTQPSYQQPSFSQPPFAQPSYQQPLQSLEQSFGQMSMQQPLVQATEFDAVIDETLKLDQVDYTFVSKIFNDYPIYNYQGLSNDEYWDISTALLNTAKKLYVSNGDGTVSFIRGYAGVAYYPDVGGFTAYYEDGRTEPIADIGDIDPALSGYNVAFSGDNILATNDTEGKSFSIGAASSS